MKIPPVRYATSSDGVRLAYVVFGEGPDLLVTGHGMFGLEDELGDDMGGAYFEALGRRFRVAYFDARGAGLSDRDAVIEVDRDADDCMAVASAARMDRFALFGSCACSAGAIVAAARHAERVTALILYAAVPNGRDGIPLEAQDALLASIRVSWPKASRDLTTLWFPQTDGKRLEAFAQRVRRSISAEATARRIQEWFRQDVRDLLSTMEAPVLVMQRPDRVTPRRAAADIGALTANAVLVGLSGREHYQWEGDSLAVVNAVSDFLHVEAVDASTPTDWTGFRTILFTDVVASTPLLAQLKDAKMRAVMRDHDAVLEAAVHEHGGRVVKEIGDAFMAEFAVPSAAVEAAIALQRGIRAKFADSEVPLRLRIGINAGEPVEEDGDLHGASVVIAKRLESAAPENSILVSDVVKQAVAGKDFTFVDQGVVDLKGFDEPVRAWSVEWREAQ